MSTEISPEVESEQKEFVEHTVISPSNDTAEENEQIGQGNVDAGVLDGAPDGVPGGVVNGSTDSPVLDISDQVTTGELKVLNIQGPRLIKYVEPVYPELARRARIEGTVVIEAIINKDGKIGSVRVIRSYPIFDRVALDAVKKWEYTPTLLRNQPVKVVLTVTVNFVITN